MNERIYFDNSATTPLDPRVARTMRDYLDDGYGNPSSLHWEGRQARGAIEQARGQVAELLGAQSEEIIFTASGTEADNLALIGVLGAVGQAGSHIVTSAIEHPAILETCHFLLAQGVEVTYLPVNGEGLVDPDELHRALRPNTRPVSIMMANNVVGTLEPIAALATVAHEHGVLFHTDAVQAAGKLAIDVRELPVDLVSPAGHKLHGPKGIGVLYVREGVALRPLVYAGGQERGLRSATENVTGIVGLGAAAEIAREELPEEAERLTHLRERLITQVEETIPNGYLLGHRTKRLPGHVCLGLGGQEDQVGRIMLMLDQEGIAVSTGSACSAHEVTKPSYILEAMGLNARQARGSLRITLGRFNTEAEVDHFLDVLPRVVAAAKPFTLRTVGLGQSAWAQ